MDSRSTNDLAQISDESISGEERHATIKQVMRTEEATMRELSAKLVTLAQSDPAVCTMIVSTLVHVATTPEEKRPAREFHVATLLFVLSDLEDGQLLMSAEAIVTNNAASDTTKANLLRFLLSCARNPTNREAVTKIFVAAAYHNKGFVRHEALGSMMAHYLERARAADMMLEFMAQSSNINEKIVYYDMLERNGAPQAKQGLAILGAATNSLTQLYRGRDRIEETYKGGHDPGHGGYCASWPTNEDAARTNCSLPRVK